MDGKTKPKKNDAKNKLIQAVKDDQGRAKALEAVLEGRFEEYLEWAHGVGLESPFPMDVELMSGLREVVKDRRKLYSNLDTVIEAIPHFHRSPLEILVIEGSPETFEKALGFLSSPAIRFARSYREGALEWASSEICSMRVFVTDSAQDIPLCKWVERNGRVPLILLALLQGNMAAATALQKSGLAPDGPTYDDMAHILNQTEKWCADTASAAEVLRAVLSIPTEHLKEAADWLSSKSALGSELDDLFGSKDFQSVRDRAVSLVKCGAIVGYYPLMRATEFGDAEMLRLLFEAGGNPNALYKSGIPALARLKTEKLTPDALQIWLDAGASPLFDADSEEPFGNGMCPSPLMQAVWDGRDWVVKQMVERAQGKVEIEYERDGAIWSPALTLALMRKHDDLAAWMCAEKGARLEGMEPEDGRTAREFASDQQMTKIGAAMAAKQGGVLDGDARDPGVRLQRGKI